jgi:DNA-binding LacI/PurR family transcriptional regulator
VARAAGVGRQTVSNVLNDGGRVGEATKVRVLEAVATLGYHPHHGARSLRSRRTRQLAYVMPRVQLLPGNYIMQQFLQALAAASARRSHSVVVVVPDGDPRDEMRRLIASRTVEPSMPPSCSRRTIPRPRSSRPPTPRPSGCSRRPNGSA